MKRFTRKWAINSSIFFALILCCCQQAVAMDVPDGFTTNTILSGAPLQSTTGLAVSGDKLYIGDSGIPYHGPGRKIIELDLDLLTPTVLISGIPLGFPAKMLFGDGREITGTDLILADFNANDSSPCCNGRVFKIDPGTGGKQVLSAGSPGVYTGDPSALALSPGGLWGDGLFVLDQQGASSQPPFIFNIANDGAISRFFSDSAVMTTSTTPLDLAFGPEEFSNLLYIVDSGFSSIPTIWTLNSQKEISVFAQGSPFKHPVAIEFGPGGEFGTNLYVYDVGDTGLGTIYKMSPDGATSVFANNIAVGSTVYRSYFDMTFSDDGKRLFVGIGNSVIEIAYEAPPVPVFIDTEINIDPNTLNLDSNEQGFTCYIELPINDVTQIDMSSIQLADGPFAKLSPSSMGDFDEDGNIDIMVKFNREEVIRYILNAGGQINTEFEIIIEGNIDNETKFRGSDFIWIIDKKIKL